MTTKRQIQLHFFYIGIKYHVDVIGDFSAIQQAYTIIFIHKHEVPPDRFKDVTYLKIVCNVRPEKEDLTEPEPLSTEAISTILMIVALLPQISSSSKYFSTV